MTTEGEEVTVVKRFIALQIWEKEETFRAPHGQQTQMESEGEGLVMDLLLKQVRGRKQFRNFHIFYLIRETYRKGILIFLSLHDCGVDKKNFLQKVKI